jgi:hypothetical protein
MYPSYSEYFGGQSLGNFLLVFTCCANHIRSRAYVSTRFVIPVDGDIVFAQLITICPLSKHCFFSSDLRKLECCMDLLIVEIIL